MQFHMQIPKSECKATSGKSNFSQKRGWPLLPWLLALMLATFAITRSSGGGRDLSTTMTFMTMTVVTAFTT